MALEVAREWGQPLSVVRGERAPGERWLHSDLKLQAALLSHRRSLDVCGHPFEESTDKANHGPWRTHEYVLDEAVTCYACKAMEAEREKLPKEVRHDRSIRLTVKRVPVGGSVPD